MPAIFRLRRLWSYVNPTNATSLLEFGREVWRGRLSRVPFLREYRDAMATRYIYDRERHGLQTQP